MKLLSLHNAVFPILIFYRYMLFRIFKIEVNNVKKFLYTSFLNEDIRPGYKNKIHSQAKSFVDLGFDSKLFIVKNDCLCLYSFDKNKKEIIEREYQFWKKRSKKERNIQDEFILFKQYIEIIYEIINEYSIKIIYIRRIVPITLKLLKLLNYLKKKGIYIIYEYPTFPWKSEMKIIKYKNLKNFVFYLIDSLLYKFLINKVDLITYIGTCENSCKKFVKIVNAVDVENYPIQKKPFRGLKEINLIGVAYVSFVHGYDKIIYGLKTYYESSPTVNVFFHIVGNINENLRLKELVENLGLEKYVLFYGHLEGKDLDEIYVKADIAVNGLRIKELNNKLKGCITLKTGEYLARGLPQISDLPYELPDGKIDKPEFLYLIEDEKEYVDIEKVVKFYDSLTSTAENIRNYTRLKLSWKETFKPVIERYQITVGNE